MRSRACRTALILLPLLMAGMHHPVVHAGRPAAQENTILWHYPHARLRVDCTLPTGTVVGSVTLPLPPGTPAGDSSLGTRAGERRDWVLLGTSLPGLMVRAALDRNGIREGDAPPPTVLRLELVMDGAVKPGWLTLPAEPLWWSVYDPHTRARLWRARIVWKGRMKVETEDEDEPGSEKGCA
ncbi:hypothetical protein ENT52713_47270 [Enterobacter sp. 200527-13]|uniref:hypothetical protein n=1 Tax=Enterobacter sp. 200527-13 TaxID=2995131 RepID=UPI0022C2D821|nr:hypothetical protein [Enterobacter sp. 200527-13]GLH27331.1 hypothetical protein ENT52713_47270 [Enterobacter sp. 200527-13]